MGPVKFYLNKTSGGWRILWQLFWLQKMIGGVSPIGLLRPRSLLNFSWLDCISIISPATHSLENIPFVFLLFVFFHLVPGKHFGWLVGGSGTFLGLKVCIIAALWKFSCQIVIIINQQLTGKHPFYYPSFSILSSCARQTFWLIVRRLWTLFWGPKVCMIAAFWNFSCQIVWHHHGHHGKLFQRCCGGFIFIVATCTGWIWCFCIIFKHHQKKCYLKLN